MTLHVGKDCPVSLMQSCVELHQTPVQFRRNLQESSETPVSTNCTTCDPYGFFPSKQSFSRLRSFGGSPNMYSKPALVWSPAPDPHGKSSGNTSSTRPGSPSSGLVHWMSMMADHNHDVHYMWNGVETKMNTSDQHATPPLQKGPVSGLDDNRTSSIEPSQIHGIYGNHGNRTSSSGSPPVSTPSSSGSMVVVPQPINAIAKGPALGSASTNGTGRKYQCKMCPQIFMHKSAMQHHAREVHRGDLKPHQCQQCLKSFSSNHQLTQHIRIHTGEKPYKCSYCDRRFKQLSHVQQHTRLHTGERPYKCHLPDCGRAFIQLSNLQQHLRNHDSQMERAKNRPFHCNICGKGFASESSLRTHRSKQHAALIGGANSQSCPVCHKICLNGEALMEHMRSTHKDPNASGTPNKRRTTNHPCPVCGKTYVNEGSLRKHITSHPEAASVTSSLRMWPCTVCQSVFTHETGLLHHMEHMRMDPKHQFAAQYVLSRAAAERREKEATCTIPATPSGSGIVMSRSNGNMETGRTALDSHSICPGHPLVLTSQHHSQ